MCTGGGLCAQLCAGKTDYKCGTQFNMCAACCFLCLSVYSHHLGPVIPHFSCSGSCGFGLIGFSDDYSFLKCSLNIVSLTDVILQ